MLHSIQLRLDRDTERRILDIWVDASEFYDTDYLKKNGVIPHVALLVGDSQLQKVFEALDMPDLNLNLDFQGVGFFGGGDVAYLKAELPPDVLSFQRRVYQQAKQLGPQLDPHYRPDLWVPHCTIAQDCRSRRGVMLEVTPFSANVGNLILVEFPPTRLISERRT